MMHAALIVLLCVLCVIAVSHTPRSSADTLFVTAFRDLKRGSWKSFPRSLDEYITRFERLARLPIDLVVYVEPSFAERVRAVLAGREHFTDVVVVSDLEMADMACWSKIKRETKIMTSKHYKYLVRRSHNLPEHTNPQYTMMNHSKVDFVHAASKRYPRYPYLAWIDFGYIEKGVSIYGVLDPLKALDPSKIT